MDPRPNASLGRVNVEAELVYLRAGSEPPWERVMRNGEDITARPELWTPYQRQRREAFEKREAVYRFEEPSEGHAVATHAPYPATAPL